MTVQMQLHLLKKLLVETQLESAECKVHEKSLHCGTKSDAIIFRGGSDWVSHPHGSTLEEMEG